MSDEGLQQRIDPSVPPPVASPSKEVTVLAEDLLSADSSIAPELTASPEPNAVSNNAASNAELDVNACTAAIVELQRLKQELQFREQQLHLALESAGMTAFTWDVRQDRVEHLENSSSTGLEDCQTIHRLSDKLRQIHPDDRDRYESVLAKALYQTGQLEIEHRVILPDGSIVWLLDKARVIYDDAGNPVQMIGIATDITEQKQVEQTLQNREDKLKSFIDANVLGILFGDVHGNILDANDEFLRIVGYTREDLQLGNLRWDKITPLEYLPLDQQYIAEASEKGACTPYEKEYIRKNGERVPVLVGYSLVGEAREESVAFILDLTTRKQTEESLKTTLQRLTLHIQNTPLGVIEWNRHLQVERWSQEAERIFGWRSEEVLGKRSTDWGQFIHPDDQPRVEASIQQLITGQQSRQTTHNRNYRKDGEIVHCEWYDSAIVDAEGNLESVLSLVLDVSDRVQVEAERQQTEAELRENQRFIQQIADTTPEIIYVHDLLQRSNVYINRQVWNLLGYTPEEIQAMGPNVLPTLIHPEDSQELEHHLAKLALLQEGEVVDWEYRMRHVNGEWRWFLGRETLFRRTEDGQAHQVLGIIRDVTVTKCLEEGRKAAEAALRQSEAHYRYLTESIPQLVWTANAAGGLVDINQRWSDYTGLTLAEAQEDGWTTIVHPEDLPALVLRWQAARKQASLYRTECRMRRQDGVYRWHLVQAVPLKDEQDQVIKWFGTSTDIEDQKQIEQQRTHLLEMERIARSKAEEANRIKDEFLRVLSHELRTPLNPILGWAKLLQSGRLDAAKTQQAIATIERNAQLQVQLVNDLIDVSQILRGKLELKIQPLNLNSVIQAAIETVRFAANAKSIQLEFDQNSLLDRIQGDAARLQQVVWNLLSNAIKFTPNGGRVEVKLEQVAGEMERWGNTKQGSGEAEEPENHPSTHPPIHSYAQITITDTGKGISSQFLPHVFEYFRQQDGSTTREVGGLGMGLAIVRHIVEMHGGVVSVSSPGEGQGATFTVRLPIAPQKPPQN